MYISLNALRILMCYQHGSSLQTNLFSSYHEKTCHRDSKKPASGHYLRFDPANTGNQVVNSRLEPKESKLCNMQNFQSKLDKALSESTCKRVLG